MLGIRFYQLNGKPPLYVLTIHVPKKKKKERKYLRSKHFVIKNIFFTLILWFSERNGHHKINVKDLNKSHLLLLHNFLVVLRHLINLLQQFLFSLEPIILFLQSKHRDITDTLHNQILSTLNSDYLILLTQDVRISLMHWNYKHYWIVCYHIKENPLYLVDAFTITWLQEWMFNDFLHLCQIRD